MPRRHRHARPRVEPMGPNALQRLRSRYSASLRGSTAFGGKAAPNRDKQEPPRSANRRGSTAHRLLQQEARAARAQSDTRSAAA